jgi:apolipoprotein N-acyltransferase
MRASGNKSTLCVTAFVAAGNWHFEGAPQTLHSFVDSQRFLSDTTPLPEPLNPPLRMTRMPFVSRALNWTMAETKANSQSGILTVAGIFLVAVGLLMFSNGRFPIAVCTWIGPLLMIHLTRTGKGFIRLPLAFVGLSFAFGFQFYGMVPFAGLAFLVFCAVFGIALVLPYVADRYLGLRWQGLTRTLIFPLTLVASEYLVSFNPFGTWGSIAYSQYESLTLLQLISVTGLYGITFLVGWFAAVGASVWEAEFALLQTWRECAAFCLCLIGVIAYGGGRLALFPPRSPTIRVASITRPGVGLFLEGEKAEELHLFSGEPLSDEEATKIRQRSRSIAAFLLERADVEAQAGAKLITFGEINLPVLKEDEPQLIQEARALAEKRGIYMGLPLGTLNPGRRPLVEDKLVLIDPSGQIPWQYHKTRIPPGLEAAIMPGNKGLLPVTDTPFGRLGVAIAFDMDFPSLLLHAGRQRADLMVVPENEYRAIDPIHSRMALYRAVENGFNLLIHASNGLSLACDYQGRVYGLMDQYQAADRVLVAQLPCRGVSTVYSRGGYIFPWICILGICLLFPLTFLSRPKLPSRWA